MQESISTLTAEVRKALNDIAPSVADSFVQDMDAEIQQALLHAAELVAMKAPALMLEPTIKTATGTGTTDVSITEITDGSGKITLPATAVRLVELQLKNWPGILTEFLDPASEEAKMQRSSWSCGSADKPKAIVAHDTTSGKIDVYYWKAAKSNGSYNHALEYIAYVEKPKIESTNLVCGVKDILEKNIIYQACRLFLEGRKENVMAEKFAQLAEI